MLPNWLYGKSKSKLAELLGGGGTPADYDEVKAQVTQNAEEILTKAALTQITNPNLLDNPWFTVNQRRQSSYSGVVYAVDRWKNIYPSGTVSVTSDGVTLNSSKWLVQCLESELSNYLDGKEVTASLMTSDGQIYSGTATFSKNSTVNYKQINSTDPVWLRTYYTDGLIRFEIVNFNPSAGADMNVRAIKLELGSVSTLAMDTAPDYATELVKCQRYFYKTLQFDDNGANISPNQCLAVSTTRLQGIKFPAEMRANPNVTINKVNELDSSAAITGVTFQWASKEGISYFSITDATVGSLYIVDFEASADL